MSCFYAQARSVTIEVDGVATSRLDTLIDWTKRYYDNKTGGVQLECVVRNMAEADSVLRNHYKGLSRV